jgi:hypothetical protein
MGTNCTIGYILPKGSIKTVTCSWDGYPDYQIPILTTKYNTLSEVKKLINAGGMDSIYSRRPTPDTPPAFDENGKVIFDEFGVVWENQVDFQPRDSMEI